MKPSPRPSLSYVVNSLNPGRFYPEVRKSPRVLVNRALVRRLTHRIVAVSADIRQRLVHYEGLDAGEIEVVYNGVAAPLLLEPDKRNALRRELGFGPLDFIDRLDCAIGLNRRVEEGVSRSRERSAQTPSIR